MNRLCRSLLFGVLIFLFSLPCRAQEILTIATYEVRGRVLTPRGEPLREVTVKLNVVSSSEGKEFTMTTNLQGVFELEIDPDTIKAKRLQGTLIATKEGYAEGRGTVDLSLDDESSNIDIVLRETAEDPDKIYVSTLVSTLGPRLRDDGAKELTVEAERKEFLKGCEKLLDQRSSSEAIPLLKKSVERMPICVECRMLLSLALLDAGSWSDGNKQLIQAAKDNDARTAKRPEPTLVGGVLKAWRGQANDAGALLLQVLEIDPKNALALQELGRALVDLKKWEQADDYLNKALQAGAGDAARILRIRALIEFGDVVEASREMDRYTANRGGKEYSQEARTLFAAVRDHLGLLRSKQVNPVTSRSTEELIKAMPELQGLEAAADQSMLEEVLKRTGESVDAFFKGFPNTSSVEQVHQERLTKEGKLKASLDQEFLYLMLARSESTGLGIEEHRSTPEGLDASLTGLKKGLMLTQGFASVSYIFHPLNRIGAEFRYAGKQTIDGRATHVIAFSQKPETAKLITRFITDEGSAVILIHGLAWVDAEAFNILRLRTDLLGPVPSVRLERQTTEIQFQKVSFAGVTSDLWLPQEVKVTVDWRGRILRNQHQYSDFKLFNTEAKEESKQPTKRGSRRATRAE